MEKWNITMLFMGKLWTTHYVYNFDWAMFNSYVKLPEVRIYHLVMTNIAMEDPLSMEVFSWENHLSMGHGFHGYVK